MHSVTAIVVAHDGARWLKETLNAALRQSRPLDRVVGVDNGSRDGGAKLVAEIFGAGNTLTLPRSTGFGEAVHAVLERLPRVQNATEWLWLLHDDCAPDIYALEALLRVAEHNPNAGILGPKLRDWLDRRVLLEIGVTVNRSGRRDTGLEPREYDQGQHDAVREVLYVSTAGMLIRRDVWEQLGGLDVRLPLFRDDLDLCWRARAAGHRVLAVSDAVAWHAEAAARRRRRITATEGHPRRVDRRNALFVIMSNLPFRALVWSMIRNTVVSLVKTVMFLVAKQPATALDEVGALGNVLFHPLRLRRARKRRDQKALRALYQKGLRPLLTPPSAAFRRLADMVQGYLVGRGPMDSSGRHHAIAPTEDDGDELLNDDQGWIRRTFARPGVLLAVALTVVALVAERRILAGDLLGGGALVPVVGGASDLYHLYTGPGWAPPYVIAVAGMSALALGKTWLAVYVLLLGCVPLAGVSAFLATRRIIPYAPARVWLAATYALLPVATGAVASGRLGTAVVLVLLPVYAALAGRVVSGSRRAAWGFGILLTVGTAFVPLVYPFAALLGVLALVGFGGFRRGTSLSLAIGLGVPLVLLGPWLLQLVRDPGRILLEVGVNQAALADPRLSPESLLMLNPGGPGAPPFWVTGGLAAVALGALLLRRHQMIVAVGWGVMILGLLVATVMSRLSLAGTWPGVPMAFAATGLLVASALTAHRLGEFSRAGGAKRIGALLIAAVAFATPVAAATLWIRTGVDGPLTHAAHDPLPPMAAVTASEGEGTLLIRPDRGRLGYTVLRGRTLLIGEAETQKPPGLDAAVAGLASGRGGQDVKVLAGEGIEFVAVSGTIDDRLRRALDSEPALIRVSLSGNAGLWRLSTPVTPPSAADDGDSTHRMWLWGQGVFVVLALVFAAPGARRTEVVEEEYAEVPVGVLV
ncbi:glycosyltransferase family 2 protein [Streptosporangiaceae bacterium NEAU-GS5]|nr:glycosyltransferase family 2 protein [Streptosporangiaceae bacterium NEAU-GS5]